METRLNVKYVVMDLSPLFRSVVTAVLPNAEIIADKFHVKRLFLWALESVRKEEQKKFSSHRKKYFKRSRTLLLKDHDKLALEEKQQLANMLQISGMLEIAYGLKERFCLFLNSTTDEEVLKNYAALVKDVEQANIPTFNKHLKTINEWYHAVYLGLMTGISNGYTEDTNNNIKVLKRICYGFRNFENFRNRIMLISLNSPKYVRKDNKN